MMTEKAFRDNVGMGFFLAVVGFIFVLIFCVQTDRRLDKLEKKETCVPARAVDYRGDLNAWLDARGQVILIAEEEDTYDWCD